MTQPAHSKLGASSSHRWMECPGSIRLSKDVTDTSSVFALEGTAAHDLMAMCLQEQVDAVEYIGVELEPKGSGVKFIANEEMIEAVQVYLDTIAGDREANDEIYVEHRFSLDTIYPGMFGTGDTVLLLPAKRKLKVYDFKYGKGVPVEVEGNSQLKYYGLGAALSFKGFDEVELVIVQPRAPHKDGPVRRFSLSVLDLLEFADDLRTAAVKTEDPEAALRAGEWCQFCPARGFCPELKNAAMSAAMVEFTPTGTNTPPAPNFLSPEQLDRMLRDADVVETWIAAVREYAHALLTAGGEVPNWKLVAKRAHRRWGDEMDAAMALHALGVPEEKIYTRKIVSPAQAEKLVAKKARKELSEHIKPGIPSGTTLARAEDPRPTIVAGAEMDFAPIGETEN